MCPAWPWPQGRRRALPEPADFRPPGVAPAHDRRGLIPKNEVAKRSPRGVRTRASEIWPERRRTARTIARPAATSPDRKNNPGTSRRGHGVGGRQVQEPRSRRSVQAGSASSRPVTFGLVLSGLAALAGIPTPAFSSSLAYVDGSVVTRCRPPLSRGCARTSVPTPTSASTATARSTSSGSATSRSTASDQPCRARC
jgi:hypothetical protein